MKKLFKFRFVQAVLAAVIFSPLLMAVAIAASNSLSEGLWAEFVENRPDKAKEIYSAIASSSEEAQIVKKANERLAALGTPEKTNANLPPLLAFVRFQAFARSFIENKEINEAFVSCVKAFAGNFIKEKLDSDILPEVLLVNFSNSLKMEDTDIIVTFANNVTYKGEQKGIPYNGFNIRWNSLLLTMAKNEAEIIERYGRYGLASGKSSNAIENIYDNLVHAVGRNETGATFHVRFSDLEKFISENKINVLEQLNKVPFKNALLVTEGDRIIFKTNGTKENINAFMAAAEKLTGMELLPVGFMKSDDGYDYTVNVTSVGEIGKKIEPLVDVFTKNFESAREVARYKACMANISCINQALAIYLKDHKDVKRADLKNDVLQKLVSEGFLKSLPTCVEGGEYILKNEDFVCSAHGSNVKTVEFKFVSVNNGEEKVISAPRIMTPVYNDARITVGSSGGDEENGKNSGENRQDGLKSLDMKIRLTKDNQTAKKNQIIANLDVNVAFREGKFENNSVFKASMKISEGGSEWVEVKKDIKNLKIYMRVNSEK